MSKMLISISLLVAATTAYAQTNCTRMDLGGGIIVTNCDGPKGPVSCTTIDLGNGITTTTCN